MKQSIIGLYKLFFVGILITLLFLQHGFTQLNDSLTLSVYPPVIELEANPNEIIKTAIRVTNVNKVPRSFSITPKGTILTKKGLEERPFSSLEPNSLSRNITVQERIVTIPPKSFKEIAINIMVTSNLSGTHYTLVNIAPDFSVQSEEPNRDDSYKRDVGVNMIPTMDVVIRLNIKGTLQHAHIINKINIIPKEGNRPLSTEAYITNTGNAELDYGLMMILLDKNQKVVSRMKTDGNITIYPGMTGIVPFLPPYRDVPPGKYKAIITAVAEGIRLPPLEKDIEIH